MRRKTVLAAASAAVLLPGIALAAAAPASAAPAVRQLHVVKTLTTDVVAPLQFAVSGKKVYVADDAAGTLSVIGKGVIARAPAGDELAGVEVDPFTSAYAYTTNNQDHTQSALTIVTPGRPNVVADLYQFEQQHNPDSVNHYGIQGSASQACTNELDKAGIPTRYTGELDTHPYAVAPLGFGAWAVADAGGNDVLRVDRYGHVSVLAVLPPQTIVVSPEFAQQTGAPDCVGVTYAFEPVPTDVEWTFTGLLVTTLPGGEGAPGSLYRIGWFGGVTQVATGFAGAVNLAAAPDGSVYVAEIGTGNITKITLTGRRQVVAHLDSLVAVEWANGHLYASTSPAAASEGDGPPSTTPPPPGSVVELG